MFAFSRFRLFLQRSAAVLAAAACLAVAACGGDESTSVEDDHEPASVRLFNSAGQEITNNALALSAGQATRVEVRLFAADGDRIASLPAGHVVALSFAPADLATITAVAGQAFTYDITGRTSGGVGSASVGYGHNGNTTERVFGPYSVAVSPQQVSLRFAARVNGAAFACGTEYANIGTTHSRARLQDWRFYVHDVRLTTSAGTDVPVTLTQDAKWQKDNLALLDFENGAGDCANGTIDLNDKVVGSVPANTYTGVKFVLGVPFTMNHINPATAPSPLSLTAMSWAWNIGYIFFRADLTTTGQSGGYFVHLGSTGCNGASFTSPPTSCAQPNRAEVVLTGFDAASKVIVADIGTLLSASNVDINQGGPGGCMSGTTDGDCPPIFARFGLPFGTAAAGPQSLFSVANP